MSLHCLIMIPLFPSREGICSSQLLQPPSFYDVVGDQLWCFVFSRAIWVSYILSLREISFSRLGMLVSNAYILVIVAKMKIHHVLFSCWPFRWEGPDDSFLNHWLIMAWSSASIHGTDGCVLFSFLLFSDCLWWVSFFSVLHNQMSALTRKEVFRAASTSLENWVMFRFSKCTWYSVMVLFMHISTINLYSCSL